VIGQVATTAMAVLLSALLGRTLGAADFGLFFLVTSMAQFAFVVVEWGQLQYVVREVARDPGRSGALLGNALLLRVGGTAAVGGLAVAAAGAFGYDARTRLLLALLLVGMLPFVLVQGASLIFRGSERMEYEALLSVLNRAGTLALAWVALTVGWGLPGVFLAQGVAGGLALVVAVACLRRLRIPPMRIDRAGSWAMVLGGAPLVVMSVTIASQGTIEALILSKLGSGESIGWFGAARVIVGTLIAPATILASSAYPRLSRVAHDPARFQGELQLAIRPVLALAVLAAVGTYLFAGDAVALIYGEGAFGPAASILRVFAPGLLLLFLDLLLGSAVLAVGRPLPLAVGKVVTVALSATLAILWVPIFQAKFGNGGLGVALSFCVCEMIMFGTAVWILPRGTLRVSTAVDCGRSLLAGALTLFVFLSLPPMPLTVSTPACVGSFLLFAVVTGLVRKGELAWIWTKIRRRSGLPTG
jgi:O-antigen/teichoic acid export membrane protein